MLQMSVWNQQTERAKGSQVVEWFVVIGHTGSTNIFSKILLVLQGNLPALPEDGQFFSQ